MSKITMRRELVGFVSVMGNSCAENGVLGKNDASSEAKADSGVGPGNTNRALVAIRRRRLITCLDTMAVLCRIVCNCWE